MGVAPVSLEPYEGVFSTPLYTRYFENSTAWVAL